MFLKGEKKEKKKKKKKKNVNKSLSGKEIYRLCNSLLRNKNARQNWRALIYSYGSYLF